MRIIAIDPGDRWCGYARLYHQAQEFHAETGVIDLENHEFVDTVKILVPSLAKAHVVTEQYRARSQGFNAFREMETPMLVGAIRLYAEHKSMRWASVPAGDPQLLENMPLWPFIKEWRKRWRPASREWNHALSAWRVLAQYMISQPDLIKNLRLLPSVVELDTATELAPLHDDLQAPAVRWISR